MGTFSVIVVSLLLTFTLTEAKMKRSRRCPAGSCYYTHFKACIEIPLFSRSSCLDTQHCVDGRCHPEDDGKNFNSLDKKCRRYNYNHSCFKTEEDDEPLFCFSSKKGYCIPNLHAFLIPRKSSKKRCKNGAHSSKRNKNISNNNIDDEEPDSWKTTDNEIVHKKKKCNKKSVVGRNHIATATETPDNNQANKKSSFSINTDNIKKKLKNYKKIPDVQEKNFATKTKAPDNDEKNQKPDNDKKIPDVWEKNVPTTTKAPDNEEKNQKPENDKKIPDVQEKNVATTTKAPNKDETNQSYDNDEDDPDFLKDNDVLIP